MNNKKELKSGKLGTTWEGPYIFNVMVGKGAYKLKTHMLKKVQ